MSILLGAIADDFTGATDLANTLVKQGMPAVQTIGVPDEGLDLGGARAVVVALKSRTAPVATAVAESQAALRWLRARGTQQFFFKYCSTFDSSNDGNIGPVADALMAALDATLAVVCPAFPTNGRTVYQGHLFVGSELLAESSMKDHPLTPMRDSNLLRLMGAQSRHRVGLVSQPTVASGIEATSAALEALRDQGARYAVTDALSDRDLEVIGAAVATHPLVTGGSGIALGLPGNFRRQGSLGPPAQPSVPDVVGPAVILAGSCSRATCRQIERAAKEWPSHRLDVDRIASGEQVVDEVLAWASAKGGNDSAPVLIYSSADPAEVQAVQSQFGRGSVGTKIEATFARLAEAFVARGARRIVVAGGETSGAVVSALGIRGLEIGAEIDPGVPWTLSLDEPRLALALKSGNFGTDEFFLKALAMLP